MDMLVVSNRNLVLGVDLHNVNVDLYLHQINGEDDSTQTQSVILNWLFHKTDKKNGQNYLFVSVV